MIILVIYYNFVVLIFRQFALVFGWVIFFLLAYKVSTIQIEHVEYNPFKILQVDPVRLSADFVVLLPK